MSQTWGCFGATHKANDNYLSKRGAQDFYFLFMWNLPIQLQSIQPTWSIHPPWSHAELCQSGVLVEAVHSGMPPEQGEEGNLCNSRRRRIHGRWGSRSMIQKETIFINHIITMSYYVIISNHMTHMWFLCQGCQVAGQTLNPAWFWIPWVISTLGCWTRRRNVSTLFRTWVQAFRISILIFLTCFELMLHW